MLTSNNDIHLKRVCKVDLISVPGFYHGSITYDIVDYAGKHRISYEISVNITCPNKLIKFIILDHTVDCRQGSKSLVSEVAVLGSV